MDGDRTTRRVFRMLLPWNDEKAERWLEEQARSGWHLQRVGCFGGYTFERGAPAEVAYRLDFGPSARRDREEYFGLYRDAGWEHLGTRGLWQFFRKPVVAGDVPEIFTDPASRIAKYRRLLALFGMFVAVFTTQIGSHVATRGASRAGAAPGGFDWVLGVQAVMMGVFLYGVVRLALVINRLSKQPRPSA